MDAAPAYHLYVGIDIAAKTFTATWARREVLPLNVVDNSPNLF